MSEEKLEVPKSWDDIDTVKALEMLDAIDRLEECRRKQGGLLMELRRGIFIKVGKAERVFIKSFSFKTRCAACRRQLSIPGGQHVYATQFRGRVEYVHVEPCWRLP